MAQRYFEAGEDDDASPSLHSRKPRRYIATAIGCIYQYELGDRYACDYSGHHDSRCLQSESKRMERACSEAFEMSFGALANHDSSDCAVCGRLPLQVIRGCAGEVRKH